MTEYEAYQEHIRYTHDGKYYLHIPVTYEVEESNISDICNVSAKYCYVTHELRLHQNDRCKRFTLF